MDSRALPDRRFRIPLIILAGLFGTATFALSFWHWWTYQYTTFDLAFYVQSLWLAVHGHWNVSLLDVPMLGNHAEPIVFLLAPLFAAIPHPMLLVAVQAAALATMPVTAWRIASRLGLGGWPAVALALSTLLIPAAGFIAIHEFHPEAFSAPLLLLLAEARISRRLRLYWLWFAAALACKENIALLLVVWGFVHAWCDRREGLRHQWRWNLGPAFAAAFWLGLYAVCLSPRLNGGRVDYGNLYAHLGDSGRDIILKFFTEPQRVLGALRQGISGDLVWSLLFAFFFLPVVRPRWLLIAAPLLLQHLLSSRPSEWSIHYHYAAPFLPLLWVASAEAIVHHRLKPAIAFLPAAACLLLQFAIGPFREVPGQIRASDALLWNRAWKSEYVDRLANDPSLRVSASIPYLSHLAKRHEIYSLHFVLKGLHTLSSELYQPGYDADAVLIDYADANTFSLAARYYHPEGQQGEKHLPSSDALLNSFLGRHSWKSESLNELMLLTREKSPRAVPPVAATATGPQVDPHSQLLYWAVRPSQGDAAFQIDMVWRFTAPRERIPWLMLILSDGTSRYPILIGMCSPETIAGPGYEQRRVRIPPQIPAGTYEVTAFLFDKINALWKPSEDSVLLSAPLGKVSCGGS